MPDLDHVRWLGGGSGAGKTTLTRLLARRFGIDSYSTDAMISVHSERLDTSAAPLLERFRQMSMDDRWILQSPAAMYATFPWFHGEGFDLLIEDVREMPADRPLLVEGFRLLPQLVKPYVSNPRHAVWLVPTEGFRHAAFDRRRGADAFWLRTANPDRALAKLKERDRIFSEKIALDVESERLEALYVDGSRSADSLATELAYRFGLRGVAER
jgi:hypothetical protein